MAAVPGAHAAMRLSFIFRVIITSFIVAHEIAAMRTRDSESFIVLPLLPIFLIGVFPMLLLCLLGPAGLIILGILVASAGLTDILDASGTFSEQVIVHGYADRDHRSMHASDLHSATRFALLVDTIGAALVAVGLGGFFWFG